jgi:hypothetical protein
MTWRKAESSDVRWRKLGGTALAWWRRYVASVGWTLNIACGVAVLIIVLHDLVFLGWPELFPRGAEMWKLAYQLSLATVASYVFFYINVHLKRMRDKELMRPFLFRYTMMVLGDAVNIADFMNRASGKDPAFGWPYLDFPPDGKEIERMCKAINPHTNTVPFFAGDWFEYLGMRWERTKHNITTLYTAASFLEAEHLNLLVELENCWYLDFLPHKITRRPSNTDLSVDVQFFEDYFDKAAQLRDYAYRNLTLSGTPEMTDGTPLYTMKRVE